MSGRYWGVATDFPFWLAGEPSCSNDPLIVRNPYDQAVVGRTWLAGDVEFKRAVNSAEAAAAQMRDIPACRRADILFAFRRGRAPRRDEIARTLAAEAGKPI